MDPRIGYGYDVHRLETGRTLVLGGVIITEEIGPVAHSDGDVLLHAICDALLGAAALGDIGTHFPDSDPRFKDISSLSLLKQVHERISESYRVGNIDATIILERPMVMRFADAMRKNIAACLQIDPSCVSIKATTSEGLGFIGSGLGIAAHAVTIVFPVQ